MSVTTESNKGEGGVMETPNILLPALRQYQHSDCSGFVSGFEYEETCRIVAGLSAKLRKLVEAAEEKDRFIGLEEPGLPDSKERNDFYDVKFRAWDRYQAALKAAKEG